MPNSCHKSETDGLERAYFQKLMKSFGIS